MYKTLGDDILMVERLLGIPIVHNGFETPWGDDLPGGPPM